MNRQCLYTLLTDLSLFMALNVVIVVVAKNKKNITVISRCNFCKTLEQGCFSSILVARTEF